MSGTPTRARRVFPPYCATENRILVDTETASVRDSATSRLSLQERVALVRERAFQIPEVLLLDGPIVLRQKAVHLFRREGAGYYRQYTSFVGRVNEDLAHEGPWERGSRVAGFSLTHPSVAPQVLTRGEQVWPIPPSVPAELAALVLFGGIAWSAARAAQGASQGRIVVRGETVLSSLVLLALKCRGAKAIWWRPSKACEPIFGPDQLAFETIEREELDPDCLIVTDQKCALPDFRGEVIGCDVGASDLQLQFPNARTRIGLTAKDIARSGTRQIDLHFEGLCEYPDWFDLDDCRQYLDALSGIAPARIHPSKADRIGEFRFHHFEQRPESVRPITRGAIGANQIGVGLIGGGDWPLGMIVRQMIKHPDIVLRTVCDRRPEVAALAREALLFQQATTDPEAVLADPSIRVVVVAPYHGAHASFAAEVLRAGKHCFVEKPPIISRAQLCDLATAARDNPGLLHVGYNRPFAPATARLVECLGEEDGPLTMNFVMRAVDLPDNHWYYWPSNGNRIISNVCHLLDYAIFLANGADPVRIVATPALVGRKDDNIAATLLFDDGTIANMVYTHRGRVSSGYFQRYVVARGSIFGEIDGFRSLVLRRSSRRLKGWRGLTDMGHRAQVRAFLAAVRNGGPAPVPLRRTLVSALTLLAAAESADTGKPVDIDAGAIDRFLTEPTNGLDIAPRMLATL